MVRPLDTFSISPSLPPELARLRELANNLRWTWDHDSIELFRRLDPDLWEDTGHNPVQMISRLSQRRIEELRRDPAFLAQYGRVLESFDEYLSRPPSPSLHSAAGGPPPRVAYFSMEFGLTESLPTYSGGLGVLAGDHLKAASDVGLELVGVGLLFRQGYFRQRLSAEGWQTEDYPVMDYAFHAVLPQMDAEGRQLTLTLELGERELRFRVWRVQVGRVPLIFLDANLPDNAPADRDVTDRLYGGDTDMRIRQEILLGMGGLRALRACGLAPDVIHMNEGHAALTGLERILLIMEEEGVDFAVAREVAAAGQLFTTHTPVAAGIDLFSPELLERHLGPVRERLGIGVEELMALGRSRPQDLSEPFSMAVLALRLSSQANAVSQLHARVARRMWSGLWPEVPEEETPIGQVTNGVHLFSWLSRDVAELYDRYLGPGWRQDPSSPSSWERVGEIPDEELWRTHERRRERLVAFARRQLGQQLERRGARRAEMEAAQEALSPQALTIGFARRFATYKRATLLFKDPERLARILNEERRPVQIIFAGKAHPRDQEGKLLIQQIHQYSQQREFRRRIAFLEDYSMVSARYLVQGCDLWLNTPRRPREASGTSGMKAAANGVLNVSVLDGWWAEACAAEVGWAIGAGEEYEDLEYGDQHEASILYNLLEEEVIPTFYDRARDGTPRRWLRMMHNSIEVLSPRFNTERMVLEYAARHYLPAAERQRYLSQEGLRPARLLAEWKARVRSAWPELRIEHVERLDGLEREVGQTTGFRARLHLGTLRPEDISVQLFVGRLDSRGEIQSGRALDMLPEGEPQDGRVDYKTELQAEESGRFGYSLRVLPHHPDLANPFEMGLIRWS